MKFYRSALNSSLLVLVLGFLSGCYSLPLSPSYKGPKLRPAELELYYPKKDRPALVSEEVLENKKHYELKRIVLKSNAGDITIDYFQRPKSSPNLILVFPMLGGRKNIIENYFARHFAENGYDSAIVHRNNDFKNPDNFEELEELLRQNVIRDRLALDYFETTYQKKVFGTFGLSRGAINVATTAGVDPRYKFNVMALGGTDIIGMFKASDQSRLEKYKTSVMERKDISEDRFYEILQERLKTDPKYLSQYIDARDTLMVLALMDSTVPIRFGQRLRRDIGGPETVFLMANHYTSILYTQFVRVLPPIDPICIFPLDIVETAALDFYDRKFKEEENSTRLLPIKILKAPFDLIAVIIDTIF